MYNKPALWEVDVSMIGHLKQGGYTLTRHLGLTEAQLANRIANEGLRIPS
ncbi:MAG: hypothetical protein F6K40_06695 [Okeania sp. SIO3I5]|nr:hypothetical protein [Okeania sp. SIO3I5]NEQ35989.1 hypothetical protein [Okeania sp. SIO3I5]